MVSCLQLCTLTLWNLTYRIYCRYKGKVGHRANRLEFGAAVRRKHMVTKKDITNKRLLVKDMAVIHNKEDAVPVDMFVQELCTEPYNPILLYNRQHETDKQCPSLAEDTFLLAIQTDFQRELYEQYAHKVVCIDATHGTNAYRFKLITVMIPDDYGQGKHYGIVINVANLNV